MHMTLPQRRSLRWPAAAFFLFASLSSAGAELRLFDNTRVSALIEEVTPEGLKVTLMNGDSKTFPLQDILAITFRGRERRMLLTGTQELRFVNGDRLRGKLLGQQGDALNVETYSLGAYKFDLNNLKGFITMPQMGRAGRLAEEMVEDQTREGEKAFLDQILDRRETPYEGAIRRISTEGLEVDDERLNQSVKLPTLYLAGARMADMGRKKEPAFPTDVFLRLSTRDGSLLYGWPERVTLDRWELRAVWDHQQRMPVQEREIVSVQVLNGKRLYLSQLTPVLVKEKTNLAPPQPYRMDRSCQGDPIGIGGNSYPWGIGVHAHSELTFRLAKSFKGFQAFIGIDGHSGERGSVVFSVLGDGKELFKSPVVKGNDPPREVSISVEGVNELTLKVEDGGDMDLGDNANWAAAQLLR